MGVKDFESLFDSIDLSGKGVIDCDELHVFCEDLFLAPLCIQHIESAIKHVCGAAGMVKRSKFLDVLTEVERRKATEEQAYWDFQALDYTGRNRIGLRETLWLFKEIHGDRFSLATWRRFLGGREFPDSDVYFNEIRFWLCDIPVGTPCSDDELKAEEDTLKMKQMKFETTVYNDVKYALDDDDGRRKETEDHNDNQLTHAKRKLNKWNQLGLEAMLFDDGLDVEVSKVKGKPKSQVNMTDLNELLELKYTALREKLMMEMAKQTAAVEDEIPEMLQQIERHISTLLKTGPSYGSEVPGGLHQMLSSLTGLMGELRLHDREHRKQMDEMKIRLKDKGKSTQEIAMAVQDRYEQIIAGDSSCADLIIQLHRRHRQEREVLISTLKMDTRNSLSQAITVEYSRLMRQLLLIDEESTFISVATTVGLAERAMEPRIDRSDWDRSRSERLAQIHIEERTGKTQMRTSSDVPDKNMLETLEFVDLQVEIVREMTKRHFYEREALIHMLLGKEGKLGIEKCKKMKSEERKHELKVLQKQHQQWKSNPRADNSVLKNILMQAMCLRYEERRSDLETNSGVKVNDEILKEILLADLQQRQGVDFESLVQDMQKMSHDKMMIDLGKQVESRLGKHFDNIAYIMLGTMDITEEDEEYLKALDDKYEVLRKRIFLMTLKDQMDWRSLDKEQKQSALREINKKEKLFRSEGKMQDMETLLGPKGKAKILPALRSLIGEDKAEYTLRKHMSKHDEDPVDPLKVLNLLADLVPRFDKEQEYLLSWLHSPEAKGASLRMKRMKFVEIKVEASRVEFEDDFEIGALSAGLMERVKDTLTQRHKSDTDRQTLLSRKRVQQRRLRIQQHEEYTKEPQISKDNIPTAGDITGLQVVYLREMLKRHNDEREVLLNFLQDESLDDLVEVAATMSEDERQRRLIELQGKRQNLNLTNPDDKEEHESILEEAAALRAVSVREALVATGNTNNMEAVGVVLLAELQEEQDKELAMTLNDIENMNEEDIRTCLSREINNRRLGNAWNVITIFTRYQGEATDDQLLKALENKYVVLRQKLLVDSLKIRMGTDQWEDLSQNEKQQKLMTLDAQAAEQIRIGQIMPSLVGDGFKLPETMIQIMGVCQHVFRNKVKGQQSLGNHSNFSMEEDVGSTKKKGAPDNPVKDLYTRLEEEKLALIRQLKGQSEDHFSESERQVQLARYHREAVLAGQTDSFVSVATMVGLMERQQDEIRFKLIKDGNRYQKLASHVISSIEKEKLLPLAAEAPQTSSFSEFMDYVLVLLENKHIKERELFHRLLSNTDKLPDMRHEAAISTPKERQDKMAELITTRNNSLKTRPMENLEVLSEGTVYKIEDRRMRLSDSGHTDITDLLLSSSLMANLLEYQNCEAERLIKILSGKTDVQSIQMEEKKVLADIKSNMADNIVKVVLYSDATDGTTDTEVIEALEAKYDALKDKLLAKALLKELGENEWNRLSEKERQRKIFQLKMKERQLRKAGRIDEANALLGELLEEQEHLRQLYGDTVQEQRDKIQERLKRRKERLAQGMSESEVRELERQDILNEEDEERNTTRNILQDLDNRMEQERDDLLRRLANAGDDLEKERLRQASLAKLKRDQRLAKKEENFDGAALILGLAEERDKDLRLAKDEERKRQLKLAQERLEAARNRKNGQGGADDNDEVEMGNVDTEDSASLQEAIACDMDRKHRDEIKVFMKLMDESLSSKDRRTIKNMTEEERGDKMFEINEMYKHWKQSDDTDIEEQMNLLKNAISLMLEMLRCESEARGEVITDYDVQMNLLADLQQQQKQESQRLLHDIRNKDLNDLQQLYKALTVLNKGSNYDNIATVVMKDRTISDDDDDDDDEVGETSKASVLKALEEKYDAVKDKLLMEVLIKEHGEAEWNRLTEKERQKKLIELKLKERQLRREGKMDEIADIIGSHLENEKLLDGLFVETEREQRERLEARRARCKQLKKQRESEGLSTDDATIDAIVEEEEAEQMKQRRRNILENLQKNFDDEKAHLMRTLSYQTDKLAQERQRQIELAKLKRDERKMKKGEKLNEIVMIINNAREDDKRLEQGILAERERQRNVAKERLEARKRMKKEKQKKNEAKDEEINKLEDAIKDSEGRSVHEALLTTVEGKHEDENDLLFDLLELSKGNKAQNKPDEELKSELTKLEQEHSKWKKNTTQAASELDESKLTPEQNQKHMSVVDENKSEQMKLLADALTYKLEVERRQLRTNHPQLEDDKMEEEIEVALVTDLQSKHTVEDRAIQKLIEQQNDVILKEMCRNQSISRREGWYDNLTSTIFNFTVPDLHNDDIDKLDEDCEDTIQQMEENMVQEIDDAIEKARKNGEDFDIEAIRQQIMKEFEDRKQKLIYEKEAQKKALLNKLETSKLSKEQRDYERQTARALLKQAQDQVKALEQNVAQENKKQINALQQKLQERRDARNVAKNLKDDRENTLDLYDDDTTHHGLSQRSDDTPLPPFGGMRREKTVVDVDVTEDQKQAVLSQMAQQQRTLQNKLTEQQKKQQEVLKRRLEMRHGRQTEQAQEVLSIGHRQKTILEKSKQDEKERQLQKMKEKVAKQREKREPSPMKKAK
ncbi:hypothetical protein ACF0H5_014574 [Mactra antiquata]